jgi:NAD(P)H-hydrate epimerase
MEHAARGLAQVVAQERVRTSGVGPVVVVCGPGNNGGDGYGCARFLASWGVPVRVLRAASEPPSAGDARLEHDLAARDLQIVALGEPVDVRALDAALSGAAVLVDALFGVGLSRPLDERYALVVAHINATRATRVAVDVPSGLDSDRGEPLPVAVRADVTAAMGMPKIGCLSRQGAVYAGRVVEIDIGLPAAIHSLYLA